MKNAITRQLEEQNGELIFLDEEAKLVLSRTEDEFRVHSVGCNGNDSFYLFNGSYLQSIEDAMLRFLSRKNISVSIDINLSEEDISDLRNKKSFNWTPGNEKSFLMVNIHVINNSEAE